MASVPGALLASLDELPAIDLETLDRAASLRRRFDDKFLVEVAVLPRLLTELGTGWAALEVDRRRHTAYYSAYFDSNDLASYRHHLQGRRLRYKVRSRRYGHDGPCVLEVKLKGAAGRTEKVRWPRDRGPSADLDLCERADVESAIVERCGRPLTGDLDRSIATAFERSTVVHPEAGQRVTIDTGLTVGHGDRWVALGREFAVVEVKGARRASDAFRTMMRLGHRPMPVSKYCLGIVTLHPEIRGNPWLPTLKRLGVAPARVGEQPANDPGR